MPPDLQSDALPNELKRRRTGKEIRSLLGIEPRTSPTLRGNHATRPEEQRLMHSRRFELLRPKPWELETHSLTTRTKVLVDKQQTATGARTQDPQLRRLMLYPTELQARPSILLRARVRPAAPGRRRACAPCPSLARWPPSPSWFRRPPGL